MKYYSDFVMAMSLVHPEVPCLHRIHIGQSTGTHTIHESLGMSIELNEIKSRLFHLNKLAGELCLPKGSVFVTFDDGWSDCLLLREHFHNLEYLQPVIFLTLNQMKGDQNSLPLPRLYAWCLINSVDIQSLTSSEMSRQKLKLFPEETQHQILDEHGVFELNSSTDFIQSELLSHDAKIGW